ncbi:MAG: cell division protein FtsQ/DivIB [Hyphomicrobiaceae bacterium]
MQTLNERLAPVRGGVNLPHDARLPSFLSTMNTMQNGMSLRKRLATVDGPRSRQGEDPNAVSTDVSRPAWRAVERRDAPAQRNRRAAPLPPPLHDARQSPTRETLPIDVLFDAPRDAGRGRGRDTWSEAAPAETADAFAGWHRAPKLRASRRDDGGAQSLWGRLIPLVVALSSVFVFLLLTDAGRAGRAAMPLDAGIDSLAARLGLSIDEVVVSGLTNADHDQVLDAVAADPSSSIVGFDAEATRLRVEQQKWVQRATLTLVWPSRLDVRIIEHKPFAAWSESLDTAQLGTVVRIAADGTHLDRQDPRLAAGLVRIAGPGADRGLPEIGRLRALVERYGDLVEAYERVSDRRWTVRLTGSRQILLPETAADSALAAFLATVDVTRLAPNTEVDLRAVGRAVLRARRDPAQPGLG